MRHLLGAIIGFAAIAPSAAGSEPNYLFRGKPAVIADTAASVETAVAPKTPSSGGPTDNGSLVVSFTNRGSRSLEAGEPSVSGEFALLANTCGGTLPPGGTCLIEVGGTRPANGPLNGSLTVPGLGDPVALASIARGYDPLLRASSYLLAAFSATASSGSTAALLLTHDGHGVQPAFTPTLTGGFSLVSSTCDRGLPVGRSCTVVIEARATTVAGRFNGTLNAPNLDRMVALEGAATAPCTTVGALCADGLTLLGTSNGKTVYAIAAFEPRLDFGSSNEWCARSGMRLPTRNEVWSFDEGIRSTVKRAVDIAGATVQFWTTTSTGRNRQATFIVNRGDLLVTSEQDASAIHSALCVAG